MNERTEDRAAEISDDYIRKCLLEWDDGQVIGWSKGNEWEIYEARFDKGQLSCFWHGETVELDTATMEKLAHLLMRRPTPVHCTGRHVPRIVDDIGPRSYWEARKQSQANSNPPNDAIETCLSISMLPKARSGITSCQTQKPADPRHKAGRDTVRVRGRDWEGTS